MGLFKGSKQLLQQQDVLKTYSLLSIYFFSWHSQTKSSNAYFVYDSKRRYQFEKDERQRIQNTFLLFFDMKSKLNFDTEHKKMHSNLQLWTLPFLLLFTPCHRCTLSNHTRSSKQVKHIETIFVGIRKQKRVATISQPFCQMHSYMRSIVYLIYVLRSH